MKISIIIPAYNEELTIGNVIKNILGFAKRKKWEIIVVDDGSTDKTCKIIEKFKDVTLICHPYNRGYGGALKSGIQKAKGDIVVFVDADGQHNISEIEQLTSKMNKYDLVIARRNKHTESSLFRNIGNFVLKKIAGYMFNINIPDLTSGFRAFKREKILKHMHFCPNGFSFSATSTLVFLSVGYFINFIPVKMSKRVKGSKSKIKPFQDGFKFLMLIIRVITIFNPLKIFLPVCFVFLIIGSSYAIIYIIRTMNIPTGALLLILTAVIIFFFGIIADQISSIRRIPR